MTDLNAEIERNPEVEEARVRLQQVATRLCTKLDPLDVGGSFLAIGAALVVGVMGKDGGARYLRELADAIADDEDPSWGGHA